MVTIPDKLKKQLEELVKDKFITVYSDAPENIYISGSLYLNTAFCSNQIKEHTKSVVKTIQPMTIYDIFGNNDYNSADKQRKLELIFNLEKEVEQLNKVKNSIDLLKEFCNNTNKENK